MASNPSHTAREVQHSAQHQCAMPMREPEVCKEHALMHKHDGTNMMAQTQGTSAHKTDKCADTENVSLNKCTQVRDSKEDKQRRT